MARDLSAVPPRRDQVALAGDHVAAAEDVLEIGDLAELVILDAQQLAVHGEALDRLGNRADRRDHEVGAHVPFLAGHDPGAPGVVDGGAREAQPDQTITLDDRRDRHGERLDAEQELALRLLEDPAPTWPLLTGSCGRPLLARLGERHVLDTAPVEQRAAREPEVVPAQAVRRRGSRGSRRLHLEHVLIDAARGERVAHLDQLQHLDHVDRGEAAADHQGAVGDLVARPA